MNTDKNGWPYIVVVCGTFGSIGGLAATFDSEVACWIGGIMLLLFWSCVGLFLNLAFSEQLSMTPLHKKLILSTCPLLCFYKPFSDWFHLEYNQCKQHPNGGLPKS